MTADKKTWNSFYKDAELVKCNDPHHDPRWCGTCEARKDGFEIMIDILKQAESEGIVCLNPPTKDELHSIIDDIIADRIGYFKDQEGILLSIEEAISKRIREGG